MDFLNDILEPSWFVNISPLNKLENIFVHKYLKLFDIFESRYHREVFDYCLECLNEKLSLFDHLALLFAHLSFDEESNL